VLRRGLNGTHGITATTGKTRTSGDRQTPAKAHRQGSRAAQSPALNEKAHRGGLKDACRPFGPAFFDQHLDPIDRELIRDRRCDSFVMLDFSIELDALVAHRGSSASKGDQPKRSRFVRAHRHCQAPPVSQPGFILGADLQLRTLDRNVNQRAP
jgi:hypothetical protein